MALVKYLFYILLLCGTFSLTLTTKRRPLVFVLCLKGFRWDLPYSYSHLPNFRRLAETGSRALWVESEFGGSRTNILSLMSGLHVEHHARRDFIETIPVINEHVGGHTRLFHWPWFDRQKNNSAYEYLLTGRKGQPEIIETYLNHGRMSLQRLLRHITSMLNSLTDENDRTNLIMSFIDEPFITLTRNGINSDGIRRTMLNIDRLIGRLLSITTKNHINLIILGDHGIEQINCRQEIYLYNTLNQRQLNVYTDLYSGTSFSFVLYPKSG
jgi:predicted AlkP superfamily pyrophosphatase or phosphodiesterase